MNAVYNFPWKDLQWIEFYSGRARATLCMKSAGLRSARLDYMYYHGDGNNYSNILSDGGFGFLGKPWQTTYQMLKHSTLTDMFFQT